MPAPGAAYEQGDFNADGAVDFNDLAILAQNYNQSLPAINPAQFAPSFAADLARAQSAQVPEPATAAASGRCGSRYGSMPGKGLVIWVDYTDDRGRLGARRPRHASVRFRNRESVRIGSPFWSRSYRRVREAF
jgi:hypothetical protein